LQLDAQANLLIGQRVLVRIHNHRAATP